MKFIMDLLTQNIKYFHMLYVIGEFLIRGESPPKDIIKQAKECGRLAEVPEEELNVLDILDDDGATIH